MSSTPRYEFVAHMVADMANGEDAAIERSQRQRPGPVATEAGISDQTTAAPLHLPNAQLIHHQLLLYSYMTRTTVFFLSFDRNPSRGRLWPQLKNPLLKPFIGHVPLSYLQWTNITVLCSEQELHVASRCRVPLPDCDRL